MRSESSTNESTFVVGCKVNWKPIARGLPADEPCELNLLNAFVELRRSSPRWLTS